jgi:hypothetical protein
MDGHHARLREPGIQRHQRRLHPLGKSVAPIRARSSACAPVR